MTRQNFIDRRRRPRILTIQNVGKLCIVLLLAFIGITIRSEMRDTKSRQYGRLLDHQIAADVPQKPVEVVREAPQTVQDQTVPDPMLVAPLAREQWLHDDSATALPPVATSQVVAPVDGHARVAIVGGPGGVQIVRQERRKPVLSGGFGR